MTKSELLETEYMKLNNLFRRCQKMYEDRFQKVNGWHGQNLNKNEVAGWMTLLSNSGWQWYNRKKHKMESMICNFNSLDELDMKLTIQGY